MGKQQELWGSKLKSYMVTHLSLGKTTYLRAKKLHELIESKQIVIAGNKRFKIYGLISCKAGKRMRPENRVFFMSTEEVNQKQFRPCGICLKNVYNIWKNSF